MTTNILFISKGVMPKPNNARQVVYVLSPSDVIERYAKQVCNELYGSELNTQIYSDFLKFIRTVASIKQKALNKGQSHAPEEK